MRAHPWFLASALSALVFGGAGVAASSPTPTTPPLGDGDAWIAYQAITSERGGAHAVHLIRPDGSADTFVFPMIPGREQLHPDWSPDGRQIVLDVNDEANTPDIWVADLTTGSALEVVDCSAPCLWAQEPAWSRDGTRIAFQRHTMTTAGEVSSIEVLDVATNLTSTVYQTTTQKGAYAPRWYLGDASLVFEQTASEGDTFVGVSLEVLDLANPGVTRRIVPVERFANNSDWSPDGSLIAFSAPIAGGEPGGSLSDIWVVAPDGSAPRQVTDVAASGGSAVQPTFTPDGTAIIFKLGDSRVGASDAMATVPISGGTPQPATGSTYIYGWHPRLRPVH